MTDLYYENALISEAEIIRRGTSWCDFSLVFNVNGISRGFGSYDLRYYGPEVLSIIMDIVGVEYWSDITGKHVRTFRKYKGGPIRAFGHLTKDIWIHLDREDALCYSIERNIIKLGKESNAA